MKIAIVYYSLEGHTHFIAEKMGKQISGDLIRLIPKKDFPTGSFGKYFWGGKSATFHEKPKLSNEMLQLDSYDAIIVGTPTWAGTMAPPVRTFLAHAVIKGKPVYLFACNSGGDDKKCFAQMHAYLKENTSMGCVSFTLPKEENFDTLKGKFESFCKAVEEGKQYP
ncbi:MAG: flavodoxin [Sphaerochaeta sp.]